MDLNAQKAEKKIKITAVDGQTTAALPKIAAYQVLEEVGKGSLTTIYKVKKEGLETIFAAKILRSEMAANPRTARRFIQEGEKAICLNDPHLVSVYATAYTDDGRPLLICDFVQGESLAERLANKQKFSEQEVLALLKQLLPALSVAHKNKSIHRDLKPANIVFDKSRGAEVVKLADFGIAKVMPGVGRETKYITPEGAAFGNPTYMSPEQLQGARLDARSDLYSLGCILYECLTGSPPFKSSNPVRLALKQMQNEPPPLTRADVPVSSGLESVVMRMLRKDPDDRYQSVDQLVKDLQIVQKGGSPRIKDQKKKASKKRASVNETALGRAQRHKREERLFVASIVFFFFSLVVFLPALFYDTMIRPPTDTQGFVTSGAAYQKSRPLKYLRDAKGKALVTYAGEDLSSVLCDLRYSSRLRGVVMQDLDLISSRLSHLDLTGARVSTCNFANADLHGACLRDATFVRCKFNGTNLSDCDFAGARFFKCSFEGALTSRDADDKLLEDANYALIEGSASGNLQAVPVREDKSP